MENMVKEMVEAKMSPPELKRLRASLGWTQQRLAEAVCVNRNTINRWEMGVRRISPMAAKLLRTIHDE